MHVNIRSVILQKPTGGLGCNLVLRPSPHEQVKRVRESEEGKEANWIEPESATAAVYSAF